MPGVQSTVPNIWHSQSPAPQGSACVSPQHTCPLGMSSQWPRFHGDKEPFSISGMLSTALGWALPALPFVHGKRAGMAPPPWGAVLLPFSPRGGAPCSMSPVRPGATPGRLQYLTLSSHKGDEGCLGHAEAPVTAGLGEETLSAWLGEGCSAESGNCWEHHRTKGRVPSRLILVPR